MKAADLDAQYARYPEINRAEVKKFMEWIAAQPHLSSDINELEALQFFHSSYNSMEKAKQVLDTNFTMRTHAKEFFSDLDAQRPELLRVMDVVAICPLTHLTPDGYRVIISKLSDMSASHFDFDDLIKLSFMILDMWMYEDGLQSGYVLVLDMQFCTFGHVARMGILQMKKFLCYLQEATAVRFMGLHFINITPVMDKMLTLMNPFLKKELKSVLYVHNDMESLYKFIPKKILPKDYGGSDLEMDLIKDKFYQKVKDNRENFLKFEKRHQVNEKLRPGKPKTASDLFGIDGNFKKLDTD